MLPGSKMPSCKRRGIIRERKECSNIGKRDKVGTFATFGGKEGRNELERKRKSIFFFFFLKTKWNITFLRQNILTRFYFFEGGKKMSFSPFIFFSPKLLKF